MRERRQWTGRIGAAIIALAVFAAVRRQVRPAPDAWMLRRTNNPDNFFIWATNGSNYTHTFTYDPHAADDWLRESDAGAGLATNAAGRLERGGVQ